MKRLLMAALVPAMVAGCSNSENRYPTTHGDYVQQIMQVFANEITVKNLDDEAIVGAQILIGDALNSPFEGNFLTTNSAGQVAIPTAWSDAQPITISAPGYVRVTYMNTQPGSLTVKLRKRNSLNQYQVKGSALGLPIKNGDDQIDFGMVMPAFTKLQLFTFNIDSIVSAQSDIISVIGQEVPLPANLSLPKQTEKYAFFNVTLDKPSYRIYFGQPGIQRVFVAKGRLPFKSTVDSLRAGKEFWELINSIKISGGAVRDIKVTNMQTPLDLPTNELNFTDLKAVTAPQFRGDETLMMAAISDQSGYMIPTDVKRVSSGQRLNLNALGGTPSSALVILKKTADWNSGGDRVSTALMPFASDTPAPVLPLIGNPLVSGDGLELEMPQFNTVTGVNPIGILSVLSMEVEVQQGPDKVKLMNPAWEVYSENWVANLKIPNFPGTSFGNGKKRWEVNFLGSQTASQAAPGAAMIEATTHVTHSSATF